MTKKAVVLLSGGLDSATVAAVAQSDGFETYALSFSYGQRHSSELEAARRVAKHVSASDHKVVPIDLRASAVQRSPTTSRYRRVVLWRS